MKSITLPLNIPILKTIPKIWGEEQIIINTHLYAAKLLIINPQYTSSTHHHNNKTETFITLHGQPTIEITPTNQPPYTLTLNPQDQYTITPHTKHRFYNTTTTKAIILEISTHDDPQDSHRTTQSSPI